MVLPRRPIENALTHPSFHPTGEALRALLAASPLAVIRLDAEARVTLWNDSAATLLGWGATEALGNLLPTAASGSPWEDESAVLIERALSGERLRSVEIVRSRKDGSTIELSLSTEPLQDEDGTIAGLIAVLDDVGVRRFHERRFRAVFDGAGFGIAVGDHDDRFMEVNQAYADIVGRTIEELRTLTFAEITHPDDLAIERPLVAQVLAGDRPFYTLEKRYLRPDGSVV
ncbi:MAG: PAS domain-containing protein [Gaiellaceae bacterium]